MDFLSFKNKNLNSTVNKRTNAENKNFHEKNKDIIPIENAKIVYPPFLINYTDKNVFPNMLNIPIELKRSVIVENGNTSHNIFSGNKNNVLKNENTSHNIYSGKKNNVLKNENTSHNIYSGKKNYILESEKNICKKNLSNKTNNKDHYNDKVICYNKTGELFKNNIISTNTTTTTNDKFKNQHDENFISTKKVYFKEKTYDIHSNLKNISKNIVNNAQECFDYSPNYIIKNGNKEKYQGIHIPEANNKTNVTNNLHSSKNQTINYNVVNYIQVNNNVNFKTINDNNENFNNNLNIHDIDRNVKWSMVEDNNVSNNNKIIDSHDFINVRKTYNKHNNSNINVDNIDGSNIQHINNIIKLKENQTLSVKCDSNNKKNRAVKINDQIDELASNLKQNNILDNINSSVNKNTKGKKKNMGTCLFNINNFSCQFFISC